LLGACFFSQVGSTIFVAPPAKAIVEHFYLYTFGSDDGICFKTLIHELQEPIGLFFDLRLKVRCALRLDKVAAP
jgi:hypothetical protein